ncbi:DUF1501 domain-containing protein [Flavobacterium faecale]|uniref:DUF1501 domain-containing protein n=1 Tax=Flavobacterium faecale TaxID=1355330 RepID=UPI003AAB5785
MKRRNFIQLTSSASVLSMLPTEVFALFKSAGMNACPDLSAKKIVLIQLSGANDGLNTIVPINQYDKYVSLRPSIKLNNSGANSIIQLDSTLALNDQVGLHPTLIGFKSLYDQGYMRIIQGVGYPNQDKSHFGSTDNWLRGGDGTQANSNIQDGWMARFIENFYADFLNASFPLGIQLGSNDNSLGFHDTSGNTLSLNINGQNPAGFYSVINGLGGAAPTNIPNSEYGNLIKYILDNDTTTKTYAETISAAFNNGSNSVTYPNSNLSNQLKSVARFISGGLKSKIYLVKISGFDTHASQVSNSSDTHLGKHADLLSELSEAIKNFITDLNNQNIGDEVVTVTFSEFGRKAGANASLGTDHGQIAPMFVFGKSINPGISGTNVNLDEAKSTNDYQLYTVQHDYRRVYSTILQDWLGANNDVLDLTFYDKNKNSGFSNNKIAQVIKASHTISPECYSSTSLDTIDFKTETNFVIFPNPTSENITVNTANYSIEAISIVTIDGRALNRYINPLTTNQFTIPTHHLSAGIYFLKIETSAGVLNKKIIVRH